MRVALRVLLPLLTSALSASAAPPEVRVENEYKLAVPEAVRGALQEHLERTYSDVDGFLSGLGEGFEVTFSDERFVDRYYDTPGLDLIATECGVRHRQRWNLVDPASDPKHGRQLLQLKLRPADDTNALNRTEVKFAIDPPGRHKEPLDAHPLLGLVHRDDRAEVIAALAEAGFDAEAMRPTITLEQRRWRVYVSRHGAAFATLTLDRVSSRWAAWKVELVELEIELNEIAYTDAGAEGRARMQAISERMTADVLEAFPSVKQDQTPKYNKVFQAFRERVPLFGTLAVYRQVVDMLALIGLAVLGLLAVNGLLWQRQRRARRAEEAAAA
ncbi:MAG: CYTH domain-containing protein [Planctomycetota bacterium]